MVRSALNCDCHSATKATQAIVGSGDDSVWLCKKKKPSRLPHILRGQHDQTHDFSVRIGNALIITQNICYAGSSGRTIWAPTRSAAAHCRNELYTGLLPEFIGQWHTFANLWLSGGWQGESQRERRQEGGREREESSARACKVEAIRMA